MTSVTTIKEGGQDLATTSGRFRLASPVTATVLGALALVLLAGGIVLSALVHQLSVLGSGPIISHRRGLRGGGRGGGPPPAAQSDPRRRWCTVDRRFNRARYDADEAVAAFAARLQDAVDLDSVQDDLTGVIQQTLEPAHLALWVSQRG